MRIGALRHLLKIENPSDIADGQGGFTRIWNADGEIYCRIEPIAGQEQLFASQLAPGATHQVTTRYLSSITQKSRFILGSRIFYVQALRNLEERNRTLELLCEERL